MPELRTERVAAPDGTGLAVHRLGEGRAVILLHGLFSSARMNWIRFGHAAHIAGAGFEAIMPDLRAHGESDAPHDPGCYPADILVDDLRRAIDVLGLRQFDLAGFSLGARTSARAVAAGLAPRRLVLAGMGLEGLTGWARRGGFFIDAIDRFDSIRQDDPAWQAVQFMKTMKIDRVAARLLLHSVEDMDPADLGRLTMPTLVLCGTDDRDNGSAEALAGALPDGRLESMPGTHMSSVTGPAMGEAIARFLSQP